jgi:putative membrane protein
VTSAAVVAAPIASTAMDATTWRPHLDVWAMLIGVGLLYVWALRAGDPKRPDTPTPIRRSHRWCFFGGLVVLWIASDWPMHGYDTLLFSVHMTQHLLYAFVAAPLLILGLPAWLLRRMLRPPGVRRVFRSVTHPLIALVLFNGWMLVYHVPALVNLSVTNEIAHFLMHVIWVGVGLAVWWPVLSPLPELPHLPSVARLGYIFGLTILPSIPASFLTFGVVPFYEVYIDAPRILGLSVVDDQQLAGFIMKLGAGLLLWASFGYLFFQWARTEEQGGPDPLYWREQEGELEHLTSATAARSATDPPEAGL